LKHVEERIQSADMRRDPSIENYEIALKAFIEKAKKDPSRKYLLIQSFACHGYHVGGFQ
jgi:hypothetical protein